MKNLSKISIFLIPAMLLFGGIAHADVAKVNVVSEVSSKIMVGDQNTVRWQTENFPEGAFVHINLIRKVSDNPTQFELVRQVASYAVNDGEEVWTVEKGDLGGELHIEVVCAGSTRFKEGCVSGQTSNSFAVESSMGRNLASVISAFFDGFLNIFR